MGPAKKRVLEKFPVTNYLPGARGQTIEKLWRDFFSLYKLMRSKDELADVTINKFEIDARNWVSTFYVTPYMHVLAYHIPAFMRLLKSEGL
ncbi:hypothetical protein C2G38_2122903, partial [Gigaspora rosea]